MKTIRLFVSTVLLLNLSGCASTNAYWKETLPDNPDAMSSTEKKRVYDHFSIHEINVFLPYEDALKTNSSDLQYSAKTFYPNMLRVSPGLAPELEKIETAYRVRGLSLGLLIGLTLTPMLISSLSTDLDRDSRFSYYTGSLIAMAGVLGLDYGFLFWQQDNYNKIKDKYNNDLKAYLFDSKVSNQDMKDSDSLHHTQELATQFNVGWSF